MSDLEPPLPTFLIIGAQKSATRWLRVNLGKHPDIFTVSEELEFFSSPFRFRRSGLEWYRQQFSGWRGEAHLGESTPGYMIWRHNPTRVAKRIDTTLPGVRLLAILRNPIDRARSAMIHHIRRNRLGKDTNLLELVRQQAPEEHWQGLVTGGWYGASLAPYFKRFGSDLRVLLHDDLLADPVQLYRDALEHLGADPDFLPPELDEVRFSNLERVRGGSVESPLSHDERCQLFEYFRQDVRRLEELTGRDLSIWDPANAPMPPPDVADASRRTLLRRARVPSGERAVK